MNATPIDVVRRFESRLREAVEPGDRDRRVPDALVQDLYDAGLFTMLVPEDSGGPEVPFEQAQAAIEEMARVNASAAWLVCLLSMHNFWAAALLDPAIYRAMWKPGDRKIITVTSGPPGVAEPVEGGYRVSGRWRYGSAGVYATWLAAGAIIMEGGRPRMRDDGVPMMQLFLVPASEVTIDETSWDTNGMRGTASHDYFFDGVFVPEGRHFNFLSGTSWRPEARYQSMLVPALSHMAMVSLGIARGALDATAELLGRKRDPRGQIVGEQTGYQEAYGAAEAKLAAGRALVVDAFRTATGILGEEREMTLQERGRYFNAIPYGAALAREAVDIAHGLWGSDAMYNSNPIDRFRRDIHGAASHLVMRPQTFGAAAMLLGHEPPPRP